MLDKAQKVMSLGNAVIATLAVVVLTISGGGIWVANVSNNIGQLQSDVEELRADLEAFQTETREDIEGLQADVTVLKSDVRLILEKVGNLERALNSGGSPERADAKTTHHLATIAY